MTKKTILIISSESEIEQNISETVAQQNFLPIAASNTEIGLTKIRQELPNLILCQLGSDINGYQILTEIEKNIYTATIPFVFITTHFDAQQWRKGMSLGADDFLIYPFSASELWEVVNTRLAKQEASIAKNKQELDYLRNSILNFLPHEMRTPLTGISASSDLLLNELEQLDKSVIRELLSCMNLSSQRLSRLVNNFLLYSEVNLISQNLQKIKSLRDRNTFSSLDTVECIASKLSKRHNRRTDISWQTENVSLTISPYHLAKLVEELIDNAFKFSASDTLVSIKGHQSGNYFHLSISDRGRGMTARQIANIGACIQFERPTYEQQGCGLGLAIVKKLVQIYGGKIAINSVLNRETQVNIYLPLAKSSYFLGLEAKQNQYSNNLRVSEIASAFTL